MITGHTKKGGVLVEVDAVCVCVCGGGGGGGGDPRIICYMIIIQEAPTHQ